MLTSGPQKKHTCERSSFIKWSSLRGPAQPPPCRPACRLAGQACGCSPHRRALRSRRPPASGGPVRGASGPQQPCPTPARPRAPLVAFGAKARANNRGLAGKRYTASYARGVALCPSLTRRASAPLARPEKEAEPVIGELTTGEEILQLCATLGEGRAGEQIEIKPVHRWKIPLSQVRLAAVAAACHV